MTEDLRKKEIFNIVQDILKDTLNIKPSKIKLESDISNDLGADSLDTVEIIMIIEERFNILCPDSDVAKIKTVNDLVQYIIEKEK